MKFDYVYTSTHIKGLTKVFLIGLTPALMFIVLTLFAWVNFDPMITQQAKSTLSLLLILPCALYFIINLILAKVEM